MIYIKPEDAIKINKKLNEMVHKGQNKINKNLIASILEQASKQKSPEESAAIYFYRIVQDHPFFGANRRTAFILSDMFLQLNGYEFNVEKEKFMEIAYKLRNENWEYNDVLNEFKKIIVKQKRKEYA